MAAALLGTVTPFCSCSSIPIFMGFTGAGLPVGVTFSFLISSPMVDLGFLVLLMSIFGWQTAAEYVVLGLAIAVAGGTLLEKLRMERYVEDFIKTAGNVEAEAAQLTRRERAGYAKEQVLATLAGVPMYADIFGTIPVAEGLLAKGAGLGTILSFMMAVTTLSLPSLIMLRKAVKFKLLAVFLGIVAAGIILVGYFFNGFHFWFL